MVSILNSIAMRILAFLSILVLIICCNKRSSNTEPASLDGVWGLTDAYYGNIPVGEWTKPTKKTFYEFKGDSLIITEESRIPVRLALEHLSDSTFRIKGETLSTYYKIERRKLTLKNPCDEGCIWKFIRLPF